MAVLGIGIGSCGADVDPGVDAPQDLVSEMVVRKERRGQRARFPVRVPQEARRNRLERAKIAEAGVGCVVPEDAIAAARHQERHHRGAIVLPEVEIIALDVHQAEMVLDQAVQRLTRGRLPPLPDVKGLHALDLGRLDHAAAGHFGENRASPGVEERNRPGREVHAHLEPRRRQRHRATRRLGCPGRRRVRRPDHHEAGQLEKGAVLRGRNANDIVRANFHFQHGVADGDDHAVGHPLRLRGGGQRGGDTSRRGGKRTESGSKCIHGGAGTAKPWSRQLCFARDFCRHAQAGARPGCAG